MRLCISPELLHTLSGIERIVNAEFYVEGEDGKFYRPVKGWIDYAYT